MTLHARRDDVRHASVDMGYAKGGLETKQVFGLVSSIMMARRTVGYHSTPHVHDCEQLNYLVQGASATSVDGKIFHLKAGDFLRIPSNAVHFAWNEGDEDLIVLESHAPGLDLGLDRDLTPVLLTESEQGQEPTTAPNVLDVPDKPIIDRDFDGILVTDDDLLRAGVEGSEKSLEVLQVFGLTSSISVVHRPAGFRSASESRDGEQITYVISGRGAVTIDGEVFEVEHGDFLRVPAVAAHATRTVGDEELVTFEVHTPGIDRGLDSTNAPALLAPHERSEIVAQAACKPADQG